MRMTAIHNDDDLQAALLAIVFRFLMYLMNVLTLGISGVG
jgi:hypothetical protein